MNAKFNMKNDAVILSTVRTILRRFQGALSPADSIKFGDTHCVVAGGMERMSNTPTLLSKARSGHRLGHQETKDALFVYGLEGMVSLCVGGEETNAMAIERV